MHQTLAVVLLCARHSAVYPGYGGQNGISLQAPKEAFVTVFSLDSSSIYETIDKNGIN